MFSFWKCLQNFHGCSEKTENWTPAVDWGRYLFMKTYCDILQKITIHLPRESEALKSGHGVKVL